MVQKQRSFGSESPGQSSLSITNKVRRGDIRHAVVVRAAKELQRRDGSYIKFDDNACVLINKNGDPIGTRLTGANVFTSTPERDDADFTRCCRGRTSRQALVEDTFACTTQRLNGHETINRNCSRCNQPWLWTSDLFGRGCLLSGPAYANLTANAMLLKQRVNQCTPPQRPQTPLLRHRYIRGCMRCRHNIVSRWGQHARV